MYQISASWIFARVLATPVTYIYQGTSTVTVSVQSISLFKRKIAIHFCFCNYKNSHFSLKWSNLLEIRLMFILPNMISGVSHLASLSRYFLSVYIDMYILSLSLSPSLPLSFSSSLLLSLSLTYIYIIT